MNGSRLKRAELTLALLVIISATATCRDAPSPTAPPDRPSFIINGLPTGDNSFANVGALLFDFDGNGIITGDDALCSGSLIAPTVFLTAAHCVSFFPADAQLYVSFNANLFASGLEVIAATEFHFDRASGTIWATCTTSPSSCSPQGRPRASSRCDCPERGCSTIWPRTTG